MTNLNANSPAVQQFIDAIFANEAASRLRTGFGFTKRCDAIDRSPARIAIDQDGSGRFLVDRTTGDVYTIKAYGRPHNRIGTLTSLTADFKAATATYTQ